MYSSLFPIAHSFSHIYFMLYLVLYFIYIYFMLYLVLQEIECLQEKFDNLTATCQKAISDFTEEEGEVCLVL